MDKKIIFLLLFLGALIMTCSSNSDSKSKGESAIPKLTYAEGIIQERLRDPNSYKRLNYSEKRNSNGDITSITIEYTAKNGFGGTNRETQTISF